MTVAELGVRMSSAEFTDWIAYAAREPFGPLQDDERAGQIAALVGNVALGMGKSQRERYKPADFFPALKAAEPPPMPLGQKLRAVFGQFKRKR